MPQIIIESEFLHAKRRGAVRRLIAPLMANPPNARVEQISTIRNLYTLGVLPSGRTANSYMNPEEPLVPTRIRNILMNYYESWRQEGKANEYYLDRAYMHIHIALPTEPKHILSLHCDPSLKSSEAHFLYKRGPHFHVEGANPDLSRAHISVCLGDKNHGGIDLRELTAKFSDAVRMIADELFPCWERAAR